MKTPTNSKDDEEQKLHKIIADKTKDLTKLFNSRRFMQHVFYKKLNFPFDYEADNPNRVMWVFAQGDKPIWNEPHEPTFDESVLNIEIAERERYTDHDGHGHD